MWTFLIIMFVIGIIVLAVEHWYITIPIIIIISGIFILFVILIKKVNEASRKEAMEKAKQSKVFDSMSGAEFEAFCANLLRANGFKDVYVTKSSGDHGIDILATGNKGTYAVQCKRYSSKVGNHAIQEAYCGKGLYHTDYAVVMTNNYFTNQAKDDAKKLGVILWDKKDIIKFQLGNMINY